ncbi:MAG: MFS transporter [Acidobacteriota bacterium]
MSHPTTLESRRWLVLASALVSFFAVGVTFFAVPPLVPLLRELFALSNLQAGLLMGAIAFPAIILSIPLGLAVDRWDPRSTGLAGLALMALGGALFAYAPGYAFLIGGRLVFGVGALALNLLLARLITTAFAGRELGLAMGLFTGAYPASMIVLFSLHPTLVKALGWRGELAAIAALAFLAMPLHALAVPRRATVTSGTPAPPGRAHEILSRPLVALGAAWMLFFAAHASTLTFAAEWVGGERALLTVSVITWAGLVLTPLAGAAIDRRGRPELWCAGALVLMALTLAAMALGVAPLAAMLALGVAASVVVPAVYSLPGRLVAPARVGLAFGFITALSNFGTVAGPAAAGALRDATPAWPPLWLALAGIVALGALLAPLAAAGRSRQ